MPKLLRDLKSFYTTQARNHLPWRQTRDPYKILVSEMMLQQTQVERVIPFYERFIELFPNPHALAKAPLSKVLKAWSGLGYNRRAKYLHSAAKVLSEAEGFGSTKTLRSGEINGTPPRRVFASPPEQGPSAKLPGVGPYTRAAIEAFAFNKPTVFVETNIRTIFIHYCFRNRRKLDSLVSDAEILPLVEKGLKDSRMQPRDFYAALMDYGSYLKKRGVQLNQKSKHYNKQSKFEGSYRQLRGQILRTLLTGPSTLNQLVDLIGRKQSDVTRVLANLSDEGIVVLKNKKISIAQ